MLYRFAQVQGYDVRVGKNTNNLSYTDVADVPSPPCSGPWVTGSSTAPVTAPPFPPGPSHPRLGGGDAQAVL